METTDRCAVVGLGNIGGAIATRLARTGADVVGVDMSPDARAAFETETGCSVLERWSDASLIDGDRVFLLVRTPDQARHVLREMAETDHDLAVFVMTTLDIDAATELADLDSGPLRVIETPVSGGRSGALDGSLTMMVAGRLTDDDRTFLHAHLARHVIVFDRYGHPTAAKLHNNALAALNARAHAEILMAGRRNGLDVAQLDQVLATSSGASWMGQNLAVVVDDLLEKDVGLFEESFGRLEPIAAGAGSGLSDALSRARRLLAEADGDES